MTFVITEKGEKMSDWITKVKKRKGYKGCRNCQHQISPMRMCKWAEQKTEVALHIMCPKWERRKDDKGRSY